MHCRYCQRGKKEVDFKDIQGLRYFIALSGKIRSRRRTGLCAQHQRQMTRAIKRARFMGLLPYVKE